MRRSTLLGAGFLLFLVLTGCGQDHGGGTVPNGSSPPPSKDANSGTEKPKIDVIIERIDFPARVKRDQEFELTVVLKNNNLRGPAAGMTSLEVRASLIDATHATDIPIYSAVFRDLRPQEPKKQTVKVRAPHQPGLWTVRAVIKPMDFLDEANNERKKQLAVD